MRTPSLRTWLAVSLGAFALHATAAGQTTHNVSVSGFTFTPNQTNVVVGDTVNWVWGSNQHNVVSGSGGVGNGIFDSGAPVFGPKTFSVTFDADFLAANTAPNGIYPYFCDVHVAFGMSAVVVVFAPLLVNSTTISLASGGAQTMSLNAGAANGNQLYWMFGTTAGFSPGFGGLPLNFSDILLLSITQPNLLVSNGLDFLDVNGQKSATFSLPAGLDPSLAGVVFHHAYAVIETVGFTTVLVSNAQSLTLVP